MDSSEVAALIGLVIVYTLVFDVMDLQPRVGSFTFVFSITYAFYLLFQCVLGILASIVVSEAMGPEVNVLLIALLGTLGGVTVLQNFALNVGGTDVANLAALRDRYRVRMEAEQTRRQAQRKQTRELLLQRQLSELSVVQLKRELRILFINSGYEVAQANERISAIEDAAEDDESTLKAGLAYNVASINPDYAARLVATPETAAATANPGT